MANVAPAFIRGTTAAQASAAAQPPADSNALFASLLPMSWRGIHFPYVSTEIELRQDLAIHKVADKNGAHVEGTGRAPYQFTARIPFLNNLSRGAAEQWQSPLYPDAWQAFFDACSDRTSGTLGHPQLGPRNCKCETARTTLDANVRSGVYVSVTWIETDDGVVTTQTSTATTSPTASAQLACDDLDAQFASIDPAIVPQLPSLPFTFGSLIFAVRGAVDQTTLLQKQFFGRVDNIIYQAQALEDSLDRAVNASALNWPMLDAAERAKSACYDLKSTQLQKARPVGLFTVLKDSTLAQVSAMIGASIADLMILNPSFLGYPVVFKDSVVRYYAQ